MFRTADLEERMSAIYDRAVHGPGVYDEDRLYMLREWIEYLIAEGADTKIWRQLTTEYSEATSAGDDGQIRGIKRKSDATEEGQPPAKMARTDAYSYGASANTSQTDPATAAMYAAYYQQYYGANYDYNAASAASYGSSYGYGAYQWPDGTQG